MGLPVYKLIIALAALVITACSGSGSGLRASADASIGSSQTLSVDVTGTVYEGDIVSGDGQAQHVIVRLRFLDGEVMGYAESDAGGQALKFSVPGGNWEFVNDAGDMVGTFLMQNLSTGESLELAFTGNSSGISGTTSTNGRFSFTATGAVMN